MSQARFEEHTDGTKPNGSTHTWRQGKLLSSAAFIESFVPPDYLIEGLLLNRFCYSLTGQTGSAKTVFSLLVAAHVALGLRIGKLAVEPGRVLYFAGENPTDVQMRWIAMAQHMRFDPDAIEVHFIPGVFKISDLEPFIREQCKAVGDFTLVVIDTSAAYFEGEEENSNTQMGEHARMLRKLVTLPGGPCVLINCHPVKNAKEDNLIPRGGGAFLNEVDGNLTCSNTEGLVRVHWQGKFRGPDFEPLHFRVAVERPPKLKDSKGRQLSAPVGEWLTDADQRKMASNQRSDEDKVLIAMRAKPDATLSVIAEACDWFQRDGDPYKTKVNRTLKKLEKERLAQQERGAWTLTARGEKAADKAKVNADLAGARYG
jgi:hypothetical protein